MGITERIANLSISSVIATIVVLLGLKYVMLKQRTPITKSIAETAHSLAWALGLVFLLIRPFIVQSFYIPSASMHPTLLENDHILVNKFVYRFVREPKLGDVIVFKAPPEATPGEDKGKDFIKRTIGVPGDVVRILPGHVMVGSRQFDHDELRKALRGLGPAGGDGAVKLEKGRVLVDGRSVTEAEIAAAVGKPGENVKVVPGKVTLNGRVLKEPYVAEDPDGAYPIVGNTPNDWIVLEKDGAPSVKIPEGKLLVMGDNRNDSHDSRYWGLLDRSRVMGKAMFIFWPLDRWAVVQ